MNLLSLVSPWLNKFYQIIMKVLHRNFSQKNLGSKQASVFMGVWEEMAEFVACNDDGGACGGGLVPIKPSLPRLGSQRSLHRPG
jgi:hypothetical protein